VHAVRPFGPLFFGGLGCPVPLTEFFPCFSQRPSPFSPPTFFGSTAVRSHAGVIRNPFFCLRAFAFPKRVEASVSLNPFFCLLTELADDPHLCLMQAFFPEPLLLIFAGRLFPSFPFFNRLFPSRPPFRPLTPTHPPACADLVFSSTLYAFLNFPPSFS